MTEKNEEKAATESGQAREDHGNRVPISPATIQFYLDAFCWDRKRLLKEINLIRRVEGKADRDMSAINRIWTRESTGPETALFLLEVLQQGWEENFGPSHPDAARVPKPYSLSASPVPLSTSRSGATAFPFACDGSREVTRFVCFAELCESIKASNDNKVLYASVGQGYGLKDLVDGLGGAVRPRIDHILVRGLSRSYAGSLTAEGTLPTGYLDELEAVLKTVGEREYPGGRIKIVRKYWKKHPPFHGLMYGQDVLYLGQWSTDCYGKHTVNTMMSRLDERSGETYWHYRRLMVEGELAAGVR